MEKRGTEQDTVTKVRKNITVSEELYDEFSSLKEDGESQPDLLKRMISACEENVTLRADNARMVSDIKTMVNDAEDINEQLEDLRSGPSTAITPTEGQSTFGDFGGGAIKETMDAVKDVCDDETVCIKTAVHLVDTKAAMVSKQLDRDHSTDQKQLDREDKEKDRQLKLELAEKKAQHEKDMALIKKGVVKDGDLEGVTFLGSMEKRKTAGERLAEKKKRAYHAAAGEEDDFGDPGDGGFVEGEELGDVDPPEYEGHDHV